MKPQQFTEILAHTLEDYTLSRSEKTNLKQLLEHADPGPDQLNNYRSIAFQLARNSINATNGLQVLEWLEDVLKVLRSLGGVEDSKIAEAWFSPKDNCPQQIRSLFAEVKSTVDVCVFTITDDRLSESILNAHRRGVRIRIITDDDKSGDAGSDADRLASAGIQVHVDRSEYHMHHKFALFDGNLLLNGSYNWTRGAAENNEENFVITDDPRLINRFQQTFDELWTNTAPLS